MITAVVDDIEKVVMLMRQQNATEYPFYEYGHRKEISARLAMKGKDPINMTKRYPMLLLESAPEEVVEGGVRVITMNIGLFAQTANVGSSSRERMNAVIKPILYPLYELFFECLYKSGLYYWPGPQSKPPHTKRDKPLWSIEDREGNLKFILSDPLDAILIEGLRVSQRINKC